MEEVAAVMMTTTTTMMMDVGRPSSQPKSPQNLDHSTTMANNLAPPLTPSNDSGSRFSTAASVDSDSEYQYSGFGSNTSNSNSNSNALTVTESASASRPLSRSSSTFSALSTTATKDGVEGNRVRRYQEPIGYTKWLKYQGGEYDDDTPPPNEPSAPPVTLNEKMQLLRTGSVSGKSDKQDQDQGQDQSQDQEHGQFSKEDQKEK